MKLATLDYSLFPSYLKDFLNYMLTIRGRSPKTVDAYAIDLRTFFRYIKFSKMQHRTPTAAVLDEIDALSIEDIPVEVMQQISLSDVYDFLHYTLAIRGNEAKSRSRKASSLRAFYKFITTKTSLLETSPVKDLEVPTVRKSLPRYLNLEESIQLLTGMESKEPARDYCIITLFLNCGMRVSELVGINLQDYAGKRLRVLGKGNKERMLYLNEASISAIEEYIKVRSKTPKPEAQHALFLSGQGKRISVRRVQQIVSECLRSAGIDQTGISPHKLRHTAATLMYQHGNVDIRVLKEILGHADLSTTEIYTHVNSKQMEQASLTSPLAHMKKKAPMRIPKKNVDEK